MIWIIIGPILIAVLVGGAILLSSTTMPTISVGWWALLLIAAVSAAVSYAFRSNRRAMWSGVIISVLCVGAYTAITAMNWSPPTDRTALTAAAPAPATSERTPELQARARQDEAAQQARIQQEAEQRRAREAETAEQERQRQAQAEVTPRTISSLWAELNQSLLGQGLPNASTLIIILLAAGTVLYGIFGKSNGKWPKIAVAVAVAYLAAISIWGTERVHLTIDHVANNTTLPGGSTQTPRTPPVLNAPALALTWNEALTISFQPLERSRGCVRWTIDPEVFGTIRTGLGTNPTSHFGWEVRSGGNGPKPTPQLLTTLGGRTPTVYVKTFTC